MTSLQEIESAVSQLTPQQLLQFRTWFAEFDNDLWDQQIEKDSESKKLNELVEKAIERHSSNQTRPL